MLRHAALALALPVVAAAQQRPAPADLIVTNARIYTVDDAHPVAEALAVRAGRIAYVGSAREAASLRGASTRTLDAHGATIIPGMIDAHTHLLSLGEALMSVPLAGTTSYDEIVRRVAERAKTARAGEWITGHGWDQNRWGDTRFPTHEPLTRAVPDRPVALSRIDGHALLVNAAAMKAANITAATKDPSGGRIERDASGNPTGVFVDNAMSLIERAVPASTPSQIRDATARAIAECSRWGLTGIADAGVPPNVIDVYEAMAREGKYDIRNYVMVADDDRALEKYFAIGPRNALYDARLWVRAIKIVADGALGSRGAALLEPYTDDARNTGLLTTPPERIRSVAARALRHGFQLNVHAIGDRANRLVLDAFEGALDSVPTSDHRFRIEHAQIISPADIPRFAKLGVIPSMQASHQTSDMYWATNRIGPTRVLGAYAWRALLDAGSIIPNGSDFPVEQVNPLISFHAAFARQDADGWPAGGWHPEQRMTRDEALKSITIWPAVASFEEHELGSLSVGKLADFVILDQDIMRVPPELVLRTQVVATYLGGRAVYEQGAAKSAQP